MPEPERLVVGTVTKPHGIRGEVAVEVYSDARFAPGSRMKAGARDLVVGGARPHQGRLLVTFAGIDDRDAAESLRGAELTVAAEEAAPLPEWSFYPYEIAGADVVDTSGRVLGKLTRVDENPANDLWVVLHEGREVLVPAVRDIVVSVDVRGKRIVLSPPEGLFH